MQPLLYRRRFHHKLIPNLALIQIQPHRSSQFLLQDRILTRKTLSLRQATRMLKSRSNQNRHRHLPIRAIQTIQNLRLLKMAMTPK
jgi:hypothetical protein